ncbi:hypothetical protein SBA6_1340012 [Candidatus Sulfopaludibacter sp. SbA6]|nr:hypothetical protein SBA6_1340012 [Candidatus Sulfopaludibacter sp. SbA6]
MDFAKALRLRKESDLTEHFRASKGNCWRLCEILATHCAVRAASLGIRHGLQRIEQ